MAGLPKWRAGNEMAERRADELRARFARVSRKSVPRRRRIFGFRLAWLTALAVLGFAIAAYADMQGRQQAANGSGAVFFRYCDQARAAGVAPIYRGQPGYAWWLDADSDGIACEPWPKR